MLYFFLLLAGFACFVAAFFGFRPEKTIPAGLACWIAVPMIQALP